MIVARLLALSTGRLSPQEITFVLISGRGWVDRKFIVRQEKLSNFINPKDPNGNRNHDLKAFSAVFRSLKCIYSIYTYIRYFISHFGTVFSLGLYFQGCYKNVEKSKIEISQCEKNPLLTETGFFTGSNQTPCIRSIAHSPVPSSQYPTNSCLMITAFCTRFGVFSVNLLTFLFET